MSDNEFLCCVRCGRCVSSARRMVRRYGDNAELIPSQSGRAWVIWVGGPCFGCEVDKVRRVAARSPIGRALGTRATDDDGGTPGPDGHP